MRCKEGEWLQKNQKRDITNIKGSFHKRHRCKRAAIITQLINQLNEKIKKINGHDSRKMFNICCRIQYIQTI